jgi:hypothetical protein
VPIFYKDVYIYFKIVVTKRVKVAQTGFSCRLVVRFLAWTEIMVSGRIGRSFVRVTFNTLKFFNPNLLTQLTKQFLILKIKKLYNCRHGLCLTDVPLWWQRGWYMAPLTWMNDEPSWWSREVWRCFKKPYSPSPNVGSRNDEQFLRSALPVARACRHRHSGWRGYNDGTVAKKRQNRNSDRHVWGGGG